MDWVARVGDLHEWRLDIAQVFLGNDIGQKGPSRLAGSGFCSVSFSRKGLPLANVLSEASIAPALDALEVAWKDCIYTPRCWIS